MGFVLDKYIYNQWSISELQIWAYIYERLKVQNVPNWTAWNIREKHDDNIFHDWP